MHRTAPLFNKSGGKLTFFMLINVVWFLFRNLASKGQSERTKVQSAVVPKKKQNWKENLKNNFLMSKYSLCLVSKDLQHSRYLENWYLGAGLDLEASDFWKGNFLGLKESGFRDQSGFRDRGCRHGGCSLNPDYAVVAFISLKFKGDMEQNIKKWS